MRITVYGTGSWGIALSLVLCKNGHEVTAWTHRAEQCARLRETRMNEKLLPGVHIPERIALTSDPACARDAELVVLAVPSFAVAETAEKVAAAVPAGVPIVNVAKGLDAAHDYCRFSQTITAAFGGRNPVVALTGPTHAEEVARGIPTAIL